jgi:apolipoprotein N-acyltransferase
VSTALALFAGLLAAASFPKFGVPTFAWIALAPLIVAVALTARERAGTPLRAFRCGLVCGGVYFGGTLYWVVEVMRTYGGLPAVVSVLVGLLLVSYLALYVGLFALLLWRAARRHGIAGLWLAPVFWVSTEWLRSVVGGGFPWALLGSSQAPVVPVVQLASVAGVYGLSALVVLVSTAAAVVAVSRRPADRRGAVAVAAVLGLVVLGGLLRVRAAQWTADGQPLRVGLVQGSVPQDEKHDVKFAEEILQRHLDLSRQAIAAGAELVIWPEAATPFFFEIHDEFSGPVKRLAAESRTSFIVGTDELARRTAEQPDRYYNAVVFVNADGRSLGYYRKMQLVPFGEYVPLKDLLFFVRPLVEAVSDFSAGQEPVVFDDGGRRVSVAICYESIYPGIASAFVARGSQLLATVTNDAWFGRSSAAYQHFDQGVVRAVEQGRYVVRAANTGISGAVDPYGRTIATTGLFVPASLLVDVRLISTRTIYSRVGDVVVWVSLIATAWVTLLRPSTPRLRS